MICRKRKDRNRRVKLCSTHSLQINLRFFSRLVPYVPPYVAVEPFKKPTDRGSGIGNSVSLYSSAYERFGPTLTFRRSFNQKMAPAYIAAVTTLPPPQQRCHHHHRTVVQTSQKIQTPLARLFARSLRLLTHSLAPHCSLHSRTPPHSFVCSLTPELV